MNKHKKQTGSVLIISLLLLIVMTMLGVSSMNNTVIEEKMAGNLRQNNLAFQSAESALRAGEDYLSGLNKDTRPEAKSDGTSIIWFKDSPEGDVSSYSGLWYQGFDCENKAETYSSSLSEITGYYVIEEYDQVADTINVGQQQDVQSVRDYFQITGFGIGMDGRAQVGARSSYSRRF